MIIVCQANILHIMMFNEIDKFRLNLIDKNSSNGYILQVGLEYPNELQELHNNYLLAPEKLEINQNMWLNYCSNIAN